MQIYCFFIIQQIKHTKFTILFNNITLKRHHYVEYKHFINPLKEAHALPYPKHKHNKKSNLLSNF